jgi:ATP/maltotriose-dependent transcriptional regulator MalT
MGAALPTLLALAERELEAQRGGAGTLAEPSTEPERRVFELAPMQLDADEIAHRLSSSRNTVKTQPRGIYGELKVSSPREAEARA